MGGATDGNATELL